MLRHFRFFRTEFRVLRRPESGGLCSLTCQRSQRKGQGVALKTSEMTITSSRETGEIGRALQGALARVKAQSIEEIQVEGGALAGYADRSDIQIIAQGQTMLTGQWAVQVYVDDQGLQREITLIALGDSGFSKAMNGARNSAWLSTSIKKRDEIAALLS